MAHEGAGGARARVSRVRLEIEYEGTRYSGWQVQRATQRTRDGQAVRTVQGELASALSRLFDTRDIELQGAGRTDAGVHALRQVAHLDVRTHLSPKVWRHRLNDLLPADIHVLHAETVASTFHARHDAVSRTYLYQISRRRTAFGKRFVWWIKDPLKVEVMRTLARRFVGFHDFASFCDKGHVGETRVQVEDLCVETVDDLVLVRITASHFLWKMVRQIVGVLAEVGRGRLAMREAEGFFAHRSGRPAELTAPPSGLFLEGVRYPGDPPMPPIQPLLLIS